MRECHLPQRFPSYNIKFLLRHLIFMMIQGERQHYVKGELTMAESSIENRTIGRIIRLMSENARAKKTFLNRSSLPSKFSMMPMP